MCGSSSNAWRRLSYDYSDSIRLCDNRFLMPKLAVDIVLLPSEAMMDRAIDLNRLLLGHSNQGIILNKKDCLPHISLAMGCIEEEAVAPIHAVLAETAQQFPLLDLCAACVRAEKSAAGRIVSSIEIKRTAELQQLHEAIMRRLSPFFSYQVTAEMFFSTPPEKTVDAAAISWVDSYPAQSSFTCFSPHITAGFGQSDHVLGPMRFRPAQLALCHLGNHCTCRRILAAVEL